MLSLAPCSFPLSSFSMKRSTLDRTSADDAAIATLTPPSKKRSMNNYPEPKKFVGLLSEKDIFEETPPFMVISAHLNSTLNWDANSLNSSDCIYPEKVKTVSPAVSSEIRQYTKQPDNFLASCLHSANKLVYVNHDPEVSDLPDIYLKESYVKKQYFLNLGPDSIYINGPTRQDNLFQNSFSTSQNIPSDPSNFHSSTPFNPDDDKNTSSHQVVHRYPHNLLRAEKCSAAETVEICKDTSDLFNHSYLDTFIPAEHDSEDHTPTYTEESETDNCAYDDDNNTDKSSSHHTDLADSSLSSKSFFRSDWINSYSPRNRTSSFKLVPGQIDYYNYGECWLSYYQSNSVVKFVNHYHFENPKLEQIRLKMIGIFWGMIKNYELSTTTIMTAVYIFHTLLAEKDNAVDILTNDPISSIGIHALISLRLACKLEEKSDLNWKIPDWKDIFSPVVNMKSPPISVNDIISGEIAVLTKFGYCLKSSPEFMCFSMYLTYCKYPLTLSNQYEDLGTYILGCTTFRSKRDSILNQANPAQLAAASLILSVKILNHEYETKYEFFPERLKVCTNMSYDELEPYVRGLSWLLKTKPPEAYYLKYGFAKWGEHDWR